MNPDFIQGRTSESRKKHRRIPPKVQRAFSRDLAILMGAGLHLVDSLKLLQRQCKHQEFNIILAEILVTIEAGKSLAASLAHYPSLFNGFYLNLIEVGEATGQLSEMLLRVAEYQEKIAGLKRKLVQALSYPALVVLVALAALTFILLFVLPTFEGLFREFDADLPWITRMVLFFSAWFQSYLGWIFVAVLVAPGLLWCFRFSEGLRRGADRFVIWMPFWGWLVRLNYLAQFCRTLGTLLTSGIALHKALSIARDISGNRVFQDEVSNLLSSVRRGDELAVALNNSVIFPPMVVQMITVGEETAELPEMLLKIAAVTSDELDRVISLMSTLIEPVMILLLGGAIGVILISIYVPLFNMAAIMP